MFTDLREAARGEVTQPGSRREEKVAAGEKETKDSILFIYCGCKSTLFILMGNTVRPWPLINYFFTVKDTHSVKLMVHCLHL